MLLEIKATAASNKGTGLSAPPNPQRSCRTNCIKGLCVPERVHILQSTQILVKPFASSLLLMSIIKCPADRGVVCCEEQPGGTQNPNAAPNSSRKQSCLEVFKRAEQRNAAEEFGAFETKIALFGTSRFFSCNELGDAYKGIQEYLRLAQHMHR